MNSMPNQNINGHAYKKDGTKVNVNTPGFKIEEYEYVEIVKILSIKDFKKMYPKSK